METIGPPSPFYGISSSRVASSNRRKKNRESCSILAISPLPRSPPYSVVNINRIRPQSSSMIYPTKGTTTTDDDYCNDNYDGEEQVKKFQELLEEVRRMSVGNSPINSPFSNKVSFCFVNL